MHLPRELELTQPFFQCREYLLCPVEICPVSTSTDPGHIGILSFSCLVTKAAHVCARVYFSGQSPNFHGDAVGFIWPIGARVSKHTPSAAVCSFCVSSAAPTSTCVHPVPVCTSCGISSPKPAVSTCTASCVLVSIPMPTCVISFVPHAIEMTIACSFRSVWIWILLHTSGFDECMRPLTNLHTVPCSARNRTLYFGMHAARFPAEQSSP